MREYLSRFLQEYPAADRDILLETYDAICRHPAASALWQNALDAYRADKNCDYDALRAAAREAGRYVLTHPYTAELLLFLCLTRQMKAFYQEAGIPEQIFSHTVCDLRYKLDECRAVYGICGTFVGEWFAGFFRLQRFALGRLQFELYPFGHTYEKNGITLKPEDRVVNMHIPRTGTPLDEAACDDAIRQAQAFFTDAFPNGFVPFVCDSWLLYPAHTRFLPERSNLRRFMERFEIIASGEYGADHPDLWRLFDRNYTGDPVTLPYDGSLRRAYVDHLMQGGKTGYGVGIFFVEKE